MIKYSLKRMLRSPLPCIVTVLVSFSFTFLLGHLVATSDTLYKQLNSVYDNMKIKCQFADLVGKTDGIYISNTLIDVCFSENYELSKYIDDALFMRSLDYVSDKGNDLLVGVNSNRVDDKLMDLPESAFTGSDYVVFVNEQSGYRINDTIDLIVKLGSSYEEVSFKVAGTYTGEDSNTIYCSWYVICELAERLGGHISAERGCFTLTDNRRLTEFKTVADKYFAKVDVSGNSRTDSQSGIALIIYDSEFRSTYAAIIQNIKLFETLMPFFYVISLGIGFLVSFLFTRNRYMEFNLLRRIGVKPTVIVTMTLLEQTLLSLIGVGFGTIYIGESNSLKLLLCFMVGSFLSSLLIFRKSIIKLRSE